MLLLPQKIQNQEQIMPKTAKKTTETDESKKFWDDLAKQIGEIKYGSDKAKAEQIETLIEESLAAKFSASLSEYENVKSKLEQLENDNKQMTQCLAITLEKTGNRFLSGDKETLAYTHAKILENAGKIVNESKPEVDLKATLKKLVGLFKGAEQVKLSVVKVLFEHKTGQVLPAQKKLETKGYLPEADDAKIFPPIYEMEKYTKRDGTSGQRPKTKNKKKVVKTDKDGNPVLSKKASGYKPKAWLDLLG